MFFWLDSSYGCATRAAVDVHQEPSRLPRPRPPPPVGLGSQAKLSRASRGRSPLLTFLPTTASVPLTLAPCRCVGNVGYIPEYLLKQMDYIRLHTPFWERRDGADHSYYLVQDRAGMDPIPEQLQHAMQICQFGVKARRRLPAAAARARELHCFTPKWENSSPDHAGPTRAARKESP